MVIIDAGSIGVTDSVLTKGDQRRSVHKLWRWAELEIKAPFDKIHKLWHSDPTLHGTMEVLERKWAEAPFLTVNSMTTAKVDAEIFAKCSRALQEFYKTDQHKLIELIGRSVCRGVWNNKMSEMCFQAGNALHATFRSEETAVVEELYDRITTHVTKYGRRSRTYEEIENVLKFWWKLQSYRYWWLTKKGRDDTAEETLNHREIQAVKGEWEWYEMWYESDERQKRWEHLPSIYNAALNNRSA